jgi:hypothetical protein
MNLFKVVESFENMLTAVDFWHVSRKLNKEADLLASHGLTHGDPYWGPTSLPR